ncbi:MAG: 3-deoxy-D-manno-octulosonic acid transferase [Deltaproteobacteria bacterium]|nr:3-deoxy-D-manno-octulosonic acid transferase [Deltaproteobacteria bacterium]
MNRKFVKCFYYLLAWLGLPLIVLLTCSKPRWRASLKKRLGWGVDFKELVGKEKRVVWFHAASVGEVAGIAPVITRLMESKDAKTRIVISTASITGQEEVIRRKLPCETFILPLDHPLVVKRFVKNINPTLVVIAETEIWPALFFELAKKRIPIVLVNGRISDYSFPWYLKFRWFFRVVLAEFSALMVQSGLDYQRFLALGVDKSKIAITGSTKYDKGEVVDEKKLVEFRRDIGLKGEELCFVAGSVRPGEDEIVIQAYKSLLKCFPALHMIIAPRHPEQFERVAQVLEKDAIKFRRRSLGSQSKEAQVVLLDSLGELALAYALADVAFVGGTLVDIGGHNPLEPAAHSCPVVVGPYASNVADVVQQMKARNGIVEVRNLEELEEKLHELLADSETRQQIGTAGYEVWKSNLGATERVAKRVLENNNSF